METMTKPIILEDLHIVPAAQASDGAFEVISDPAKALQAVRAGAGGIFDIFQPRTDDQELNNLLEKYLEQVKKEGVMELMMSGRYPESKARQVCDEMLQMFKTAEQLPYGAAIAYEAAKRHRPFVICSDLHRHSREDIKRSPEYQFNGWALLSPFAKYLTEEEFKDWDGLHLESGLVTGMVDKSSVATWERAIKKFQEQ